MSPPPDHHALSHGRERLTLLALAAVRGLNSVGDFILTVILAVPSHVTHMVASTP